jgi:hypothetical protein
MNAGINIITDFRLLRSFSVDVGLVSLHHMDVGSVADVSAVPAASS